MDVRFFDNSLKELSDDINLAQQRSFLYGDGHFTTVKVVVGQVEFLPLHIDRLKLANKRLGFNPLLWHKLSSLIQQTAASLSLGVIKIQISRGTAQRGYGQTAQTQPLIVVSASALTEQWLESQQTPMHLPIADTQLGLQPLLAGIKHCNRLEQVIISQEIEQAGFEDALVLNLNGHVIETNKANVFWYDGQHWFTPQLEQSGVSGVMRQHLLNTVEVTVTEITLDSLLSNAQAMFICNSLIGIRPVKQIAQKQLSLIPVEQLRAKL